ncbi:type II toxin-antitoxin system PemK/MazF family toxin [Aliarcobacter cryaerophilus]|uniref:type II toxin-antitoxin system PemK/MazF family toxin n=1 Tax=Aliarcobacter cryaerophilus TaxID=28198 RepID=UPI0021B50053|nr:type II toxin-antitoxin system PemK/MazF family toxin [Aliarcobacter cryaerophilus]MCT7471373.1 type II toxin-antitoxin system PemK/MazF family toxin [Aliarcobacter cryaerophilus]
MMVSRGEIWLANLNPTKKNNEIGKVRPVLIYQNDELNHNNYPTTIVIPLTTKLIDNAEPIRMRIKSKDKLKDDSDLVITHIRAKDNSRFIEKLTILNYEQMQKVKELLNEIVQ